MAGIGYPQKKLLSRKRLSAALFERYGKKLDALRN
jgi:hypothetical protein